MSMSAKDKDSGTEEQSGRPVVAELDEDQPGAPSRPAAVSPTTSLSKPAAAGKGVVSPPKCMLAATCVAVGGDVETDDGKVVSSGHIQTLPADDEVVWVKFEGQRDEIPLTRKQWKYALIDTETAKPENEWTEWISVSALALTLAYGMTIHKSQGQTLSAAHISLGAEISEPGQAYVAISRLNNLDGLSLSDFSPSSLRTDPIVRDFYDLLENNNTTRSST